jgi:hypothetical protein
VKSAAQVVQVEVSSVGELSLLDNPIASEGTRLRRGVVHCRGDHILGGGHKETSKAKILTPPEKYPLVPQPAPCLTEEPHAPSPSTIP